MSIKIYSDKEKILQYLKNKGISKNKFYIETGLSNGFLDSGSSFSLENLRLILDKYRDINIDWLLSGKGEMLKEQVKTTDLLSEPATIYRNEKKYPLVSITAVGGFGNSDFTINERDVKDYYVIPKFQHKKVDFMIEVEGPSMYPKYNSGDVVACRIINEEKFIQWNKAHVIATKSQGIIIKRIRQGADDSLLMISDNQDYAPFPVPVDEIDGIALVIGVVRLE